MFRRTQRMDLDETSSQSLASKVDEPSSKRSRNTPDFGDEAPPPSSLANSTSDCQQTEEFYDPEENNLDELLAEHAAYEDPPEIEDKSTEEDTFKILLATDNHLGFANKDPIRSNDSFITFEEILQMAVENDVDFVLLGGDLFHENKPARDVVLKCMQLLRNYCMGDKPVRFAFLSEEHQNFAHCAFAELNYSCGDYNIELPVFSIHGNHDDPTGRGNYCALDMLATAGLVNYFGRQTNLEQIQLRPLLLQKGRTRLALYGLGAIKDERLYNLFLQREVRFFRPQDNADDWFNILTVHQNRYRYSAKNYLPTSFIPNFFDLIFWGHEHDCKIKPWLENESFFITQPGSSVATSLRPLESMDKYVGLLKVCASKFTLKRLRLKTVRPFFFEEIVMAEIPNIPPIYCAKEATEFCEKYCINMVKKMLKEKDPKKYTDDERQPQEPLIRLRIDYSGGYEPFSIHRFGQAFVGSVANPKDMVHFHRRREQRSQKIGHSTVRFDDVSDIEAAVGLRELSVEDVIDNHFESLNDDENLKVMTRTGLRSALHFFTEKDEKEAIYTLVRNQMERLEDYLVKENATTTNMTELIDCFRRARQQQQQQQQHHQQQQQDWQDEGTFMSAKTTTSKPSDKGDQLNRTETDSDENLFTNSRTENTDDTDNDPTELTSEATTPPKRGRGRGRARGRPAKTSPSRGGRGRGRRRGRGAGAGTPRQTSLFQL